LVRLNLARKILYGNTELKLLNSHKLNRLIKTCLKPLKLTVNENASSLWHSICDYDIALSKHLIADEHQSDLVRGAGWWRAPPLKPEREFVSHFRPTKKSFQLLNTSAKKEVVPEKYTAPQEKRGWCLS